MEKQHFNIDENRLDRECISLPSDYLKYATQAADSKSEMDEAKRRMDVTQADASREIRSNPSEFGLDKVTEAGVASALATHPRMVKAQKRFNRARHAHEIAQACVWAMEHKKRSLTLLVDLHGMGYFANVKVSKKGREAVNDINKKHAMRRPSRSKQED